MTIQASIAVQNAMLSALVSTIGNGGTIEIWAGTMPASCDSADASTRLAIFTLPGTPWATSDSHGSIDLAGTLPLSSNPEANGTATHYRVKSAGGVCGLQGTITGRSDGGDLALDRTTVVVGVPLQLWSWRLTAPGG